jgi:hypothetical protein
MEPTIKELKARIAKLEKGAEHYRRMEQAERRHRSGKPPKKTKKQIAKSNTAARERRSFKARFSVGRGAKPGVPTAQVVSGGRFESKG